MKQHLIYIRQKVITVLAVIASVLLVATAFLAGRVYQKELNNEPVRIIIIQPKWNPSYEQKARQIARKYGVDEELVLAVMWQESRFNPDCESKKGAYGLMQLMPQTASDLGLPKYHSWEENLDGGIRYLKWLNERVSGISQLLIAYNWGIGNLRKYVNGKVKSLPSETEQYVKLVQKHMVNKPWKGV